MKKDKKTKQNQKKQKFFERRTRADNTPEFIFHESPTKTWWGRLILGLILISFFVIPVVALIIALINQ